jgi:hypothetical protein
MSLSSGAGNGGTLVTNFGSSQRTPEFLQNPNTVGNQQVTVGNISFPGSAQNAVGAASFNKDEALKKFFGQPKPSFFNTTSEYDQYDIENFDLPDAYKGPNKFIRNILIAKITDADEFPIKRMAPLRKQEQHLEIQWDQWIFNQGLLGRTPEESVSRLLSSHFTSKRDFMVRYGIALLLEHGFYKSPMGQKHYVMQLQQIANATVDTLAHGSIFYILNCPPPSDFHSTHRLDTSNRSINALDRAFQQELEMFAIVQKTEDGMLLLYNKMQEAYKERNTGEEADIFLAPAGMKIYAAGRPENRYFYLSGKSRGSTDPLPGVSVTESRAFRQGDAPNDDPCYRERTIGGFFQMTNSHITHVPAAEYQTAMMDTWIYSENVDDYVRISFKDSFKYMGLYDFNGQHGAPGPAPNGHARIGDEASLGYARQAALDDDWSNSSEHELPVTDEGLKFWGSITNYGDAYKRVGLLDAVTEKISLLPPSIFKQFLDKFAKASIPARGGSSSSSSGSSGGSRYYNSPNRSGDSLISVPQNSEDIERQAHIAAIEAERQERNAEIAAQRQQQQRNAASAAQRQAPPLPRLPAPQRQPALTDVEAAVVNLLDQRPSMVPNPTIISTGHTEGEFDGNWGWGPVRERDGASRVYNQFGQQYVAKLPRKHISVQLLQSAYERTGADIFNATKQEISPISEFAYTYRELLYTVERDTSIPVVYEKYVSNGDDSALTPIEIVIEKTDLNKVLKSNELIPLDTVRWYPRGDEHPNEMPRLWVTPQHVHDITFRLHSDVFTFTTLHATLFDLSDAQYDYFVSNGGVIDYNIAGQDPQLFKRRLALAQFSVALSAIYKRLLRDAVTGNTPNLVMKSVAGVKALVSKTHPWDGSNTLTEDLFPILKSKNLPVLNFQYLLKPVIDALQKIYRKAVSESSDSVIAMAIADFNAAYITSRYSTRKTQYVSDDVGGEAELDYGLQQYLNLSTREKREKVDVHAGKADKIIEWLQKYVEKPPGDSSYGDLPTKQDVAIVSNTIRTYYAILKVAPDSTVTDEGFKGHVLELLAAGIQAAKVIAREPEKQHLKFISLFVHVIYSIVHSGSYKSLATDAFLTNPNPFVATSARPDSIKNIADNLAIDLRRAITEHETLTHSLVAEFDRIAEAARGQRSVYGAGIGEPSTRALLVQEDHVLAGGKTNMQLTLEEIQTVLYGVPTADGAWLWFALNNNIHVPVSAIGWRPSKTYLSGTAVMMKGGGAAAFTWVCTNLSLTNSFTYAYDASNHLSS